MIKICYIIGELGNAGAEKQLYELVKRVNRFRFDSVVISLSQGGFWNQEIRKLGVEVIELQRRKHIEFARLFKLVKLLKQINPDIVHTYMFSANSYGRIAALMAKVPIIIASERNLPDLGMEKTIYQIPVDKFLSFFSQAIICNSYKASEALVKKYKFQSKKVFSIHNGIDTNYFLSALSSHHREISNQKVIGTIGRLCSQKNHKLFLDMAKIVLVKCENKDLKFVIVGDGELKPELERYAQYLGIKNKMVFTGARNDIPKLLLDVDVFVMTSLYEGLPNVMMEAMLAGLPVVATHVGGVDELIRDGETGFLCPSNNPLALADRVAMLINNKEEAQRLGENGKRRILNEFGVKKMVKHTENLYEEFLYQSKKI